MTDARPIASRSSRSPCMPPSVTAVTAVTTADADERTRVRAAHAIGARCRGEAQPRCNDSRSAVQALRTARVSQVRRTRVCERVLKNAFLDTTLRKLTVTRTQPIEQHTDHSSHDRPAIRDEREAADEQRAGAEPCRAHEAGPASCGAETKAASSNLCGEVTMARRRWRRRRRRTSAPTRPMARPPSGNAKMHSTRSRYDGVEHR